MDNNYNHQQQNGNFNQYPNQPQKKNIGCGKGCLIFVVAFFVLFVLPISCSIGGNSSPSTSSSSQTEVSYITETSSANTSTELENETNTAVETEIETDTTSKQSSNSNSKKESSSKAKPESSSKSENSSKETESKIEVEKPKSNYILDFDSVQYGEYNIDGLEIPNGKIESVIRGGSDGNTLVVKVAFDDASSPTMKSYENVCDLIINHGFDKGSKIDYWAVNNDGVKVKAFILNSSYFNDIKDGTLPYNALHLFLQDEYPAY